MVRMVFKFVLFSFPRSSALKHRRRDVATLDSLASLYMRQGKLANARHVYHRIWRLLLVKQDKEEEEDGEQRKSSSRSSENRTNDSAQILHLILDKQDDAASGQAMASIRIHYVSQSGHERMEEVFKFQFQKLPPSFLHLHKNAK